MYTVIYSKSPYLLARMATDLQMVGMKMWRDDSPFDEERNWLAVYEKEPRLGFYNHKCIGPAIRHTLTARNYLKVLGAILNSKK